ncbi:MAG: T9SS type A sorting domain-containing protein [Bacteroidota bacterium]
MKQVLFFAFFLSVLSLHSQEVRVKKVLLLNGGSFGNPADNANVQLLDPVDLSLQSVDTIQTGSVQDALIDGTRAYVAAQDSIVLYDLISGDRIAATAFGAPSTIHMELSDNYLLVGNWYFPFNHVGPYLNNFRVFDRHSLTFIDSIPAISLPAKDFVVVGNDVYITQNYPTPSFKDSAGYLIRLDLNSLSVVDTFEVNANDEDLGRLVLLDSVLYGLNNASNTITTVDLSTGMGTTDSANANIAAGAYGSLFSVDEEGILYTIINGSLASYDLINRAVISADLIDTVITAFAHDTLSDQFYITQTDYFSFSLGGVYDNQGNKIGAFSTGSSPEVAEVIYNVLPIAVNDYDTTGMAQQIKIAVRSNDADPDSPELPSIGMQLLTPPTQGMAIPDVDYICYTPDVGFLGEDSLEYVVLDQWGDSASAWVYLHIRQVGAVDISEELNLSLFPNPAYDKMQLYLEQAWSGNIEILDLQGRVLFQREVATSLMETFDVNQFPPSLYILRGSNEDEFWQKRFLIQR